MNLAVEDRSQIQAHDVQHVNKAVCRVLLIINNEMRIFMINYHQRGFKSCKLIVHRPLADPQEEVVYDGKFFNMDVVFTKKRIANRSQNEEGCSERKSNHYVVLQKITELPLNWYSLDYDWRTFAIFTKNCKEDEALKIHFCSQYLHMILSTSNTIEMCMISPFMREIHKKDLRSLEELKANNSTNYFAIKRL